MDVPPTTPVETAQAETQPAIDALRRLAATRDALARMLDAKPPFIDVSATGARQLLDALPVYWASTEAAEGKTRIASLAGYLASVMREEATLRGLDGTLGEDAASLATRIAAVDDRPLPAGVHGLELMMGDASHAGSLIVTDDAKPNLALLFTAHGGWEAFDSLDRLLETSRRRLLESVDTVDGSGLDNDTFAEAKVQNGIGSRDISGGVFTTLASRIVDVQIARIAVALDDHDLDRDHPDAPTRMGDRIRHELSPAAILDIDAIESLREARLLEATLARRLVDVPDDVRTTWYAARDAYGDTLATTAMLRMIAGTQPPLSLHAFASRELASRLKALGIEESAEEITVEIVRPRVLPELLNPLDPLPGSTTPRRMSLIDLACQNIGRFSLENLHATNAEGTSLRDRLGHADIRDMVRDLDLANRYRTHLEQHLRQGPAGALARKLAMMVQAAQIRLEAAQARLSYYLPGEPRSFIDDRDERGFRWVKAALDTPAGKRRVDGHEIAVSQVTYRQVPLDGILIFGTHAPASVPRIVMYTPDAPDGLAFREFESRQEAAKRFFYHPAFREYLLDRLPAEFASVSVNGTTRQFAGDRLAHWVLGASGDASYTFTAEPFDERVVRGDFFAATYDDAVEKQRHDTRFLARSTANADSDALLGYLQNRFQVVSPGDLVAAALVDAPVSLGRLMQASWRFYDHVKAGDTGEAFVAFTAGYVAALGLVAPPLVGTRSIATAIVRSRAASGGIASTGVRLMPPRVRFDDRYAVHGVRNAGRADREGIFRVRGKSYIEQDGTRYLVRRDVDYDRWRLAPPQGALDARFTGPLIERVDGRWIYAHDAGLRGGMRRLRRQLARLSARDDAAPPPVAAVGNAPVVAPVPPAPPRRRFAQPIEDLRAEAEAAQAANPSANVLVRTDGRYVKVVVEPRSALIVDPNLHPDIATLSAHQRRVFLHELDSRFPLAAERAEVLHIGAWAQQDGRRIPSPPGSPGIAQGDNIQSPSISSTSDSLPSPPTLAPHQQGRWDEALAAARRAPRSASRTAAAGIDDAVNEALPAAEVVPRDEWPARAWIFSEREFPPDSRTDGLTLGPGIPLIDPVPGIHTYPISVLPPETPTNLLSDVLGVSRIQQAGGRDPLGYWMQIDIARLRNTLQDLSLRRGLRSVGLEIHRRVLPSGEYQYTLIRLTFPMHFAPEVISGTGSRLASSDPLARLRP